MRTLPELINVTQTTSHDNSLQIDRDKINNFLHKKKGPTKRPTLIKLTNHLIYAKVKLHVDQIMNKYADNIILNIYSRWISGRVVNFDYIFVLIRAI